MAGIQWTTGGIRQGALAVGLAAVSLLVGCQLTRDLGGVELRHAQCAPGEQIECSCRDGRRGEQVCNDAGTFEPCRCGDAGVADAGS